MINFISGGVTAPKGFKASGIHCGIRKNKEKRDLALILADTECDTAAVYTKNLVYGAPITVTKNNIADGKARAIICNSGIANTCNCDGVEKAQLMCSLAAEATGLKATDFIVASTGVIGQPINIEPIKSGLPLLVKELSFDGSDNAAQAIMTTDTVKKEFAAEFTLGEKKCRIGAIAKGSGMIHPNMATMLCFITTDVNIDSKMLKNALLDVVDDSFNMLSVDGDTSTNDTVAVLASGKAQNKRIEEKNEDYYVFVSALAAVSEKIVKLMAKDGEGATKLVECQVSGAESEKVAKACAKSVICSSLVKAAMFGADANWGRILCALGYAGADIDVNKVDVWFKSEGGEILVCKDGTGVEFSEELAKEILIKDEIYITVSLGDGEFSATAYGCDLTYEYVKINGDYRT
ncbi:MAG: bifunctional glutamate N-acetyltransferase/amino-acid acetyltransferase ArgJ [Acutalibacteraceae bacterium]|nr:bifunctional glutamate N-acetyltransferase/amino-acid acetyltransferase ArgJ [Acutalibacteraceae bacterium]